MRVTCNIKLVFIIAVLMVFLSACSEISSPSGKTDQESANFSKTISNIKSQGVTNVDIQKVTDKDVKEAKSTVHPVTNKDIDEAKLVVEKHFKAMTEGDLESFQETLSRYWDGWTDKSYMKEAFKKPKRHVVKSINYPGKYHAKDEVPSSYVSNYHKEPYKTIIFHVVNEISDGKKAIEKSDRDYILIKETENSPWLIHNWGY